MMTGPGLALFYCGLVRKKNVLSVMMQCIFLMCLMSVIWALYGFGLSFGNDPEAGKKSEKPAYGSWIGYIGDVRYYLFMDHVAPTWDDNLGPNDKDGKPLVRHEWSISIRRLTDRHDGSHGQFHALPVHVLHHHSGPDLRGICRADEVQHDGRFHDSLGDFDLLSAGPLGMGRRHFVLREQACYGDILAAGHWILPVERWCISVPAFRR